MWPQRWLGLLYSKLWTLYGGETFNLAEIVDLVGSAMKARVAVSRLKKLGLIYLFSAVDRRRHFVLGYPVFLPYLATGRVRNLDLIRQGRYARLVGSFSLEALEAFQTIKSIVLYGSVSRGTAKTDSDVDLLILTELNRSIGERIQQLSQLEDVGLTRRELDWLDAQGVYTHISILPLTRDEALAFPPVLLDIVEEGVPIVDDGTFLDLRNMLHTRLVRAGARREFLSPNEWYWDLAPRLEAGDVYAL